jgi:hypothetical protein
MPSWKKVIVSGSDAVLNSLNVATNVTASSFTGSFIGPLSGTASFSQTASFINPLRQNVQLTGSLFISSSTAALNLFGSGSSVFSVDGTSGRLFSVDDSMSGSLFSVNTAAGLPIIEAFSDNTIRMGQFGQKGLFVSGSRVGIGKETPLNATLDISGSVIITGSLAVTTGSLLLSSSLIANQNSPSLPSGTQTILTNPTSSYTAAFYNYVLTSGVNTRAGQFIATWNGGSIQYMDNSTVDIGNTLTVALTASLSGANVLLTSTLPSSGWTIKTLINLL